MLCPSCNKAVSTAARNCPYCNGSLMGEPADAGAAGTPPVYSGFWMRVVAYLADAVLSGLAMLAIMVPLYFIVPGADSGFDQMEAIINVVSLVGGWLYFALMESSAKQATVGKMLLGMQVTTLDGGRISFGQATGRYFAKLISALILLIGFIMVAFTARKQGLHDLMASTLVSYRDGGPRKAGCLAAAGVVLLPLVAIVLVIAAIGLPAYQSYLDKAKAAVEGEAGVPAGPVSQVTLMAEQVGAQVDAYIMAYGELPVSLEDAGYHAQEESGVLVSYNADSGEISVMSRDGTHYIALVPGRAADDSVVWDCTSDSIAADEFPPRCLR